MLSNTVNTLCTGIYDLSCDLICKHLTFKSGSKVYIEVYDNGEISVTDGFNSDIALFIEPSIVSIDTVATDTYNTHIKEITNCYNKKYNLLYPIACFMPLIILVILIVISLVLFSVNGLLGLLMLFVSCIATVISAIMLNNYLDSLIDKLSDDVKTVQIGILK